MSAARHWHQHPGAAVRWVLLLVVLAAHAALLWLWPIGRPQAVLPQITPVTVVLVGPAEPSRLVAKADAEAPKQRTAPARQVADAATPQSQGPTSPQDPAQAARQPVPQAAQGYAVAPIPASAQVNAAARKAPSGETPAAQVAAESPTGSVRDAGTAASSTGSAGARVDGSAQTPGAIPAPGIGTVAAAPGTAQTIRDICPHTVKAVPPARATQAGLGGMVLARATIQGGKVRRVDILKSEPGGLFDAAVRTAMAQYVCRDQGALEVLAEQWFEFKVVE